MGQPEQLPAQPSSPYLLVAGLRKLPEHLVQLGLLLLQVPVLLAQLLLQHRGPGDQQGRREALSSSHGRENPVTGQDQVAHTGCAFPDVRAECQSFFFWTRSIRVLLPKVPLAKELLLRSHSCPRAQRLPRDQSTNRSPTPICTSAGHSAATTKTHNN